MQPILRPGIEAPEDGRWTGAQAVLFMLLECLRIPAGVALGQGLVSRPALRGTPDKPNKANSTAEQSTLTLDEYFEVSYVPQNS